MEKFTNTLVFLCLFPICIIASWLWERDKWKLYLLSVLLSFVILTVFNFYFIALFAPLALLIASLLGKRKNVSFSFFEYVFMALFSYVILGVMNIIFLIIWFDVLGMPK